MSIPSLSLLVVPGRYAICRLDLSAPFPPWPVAGELFAVARTKDEMSVVCPEETVPPGTHCEIGWRCFRVAGAIPFSAVGILADLTTALAEARISVFALSTFDTDCLLVRDTEFSTACEVLRGRGHVIE
jgi:hypothetical protein